MAEPLIRALLAANPGQVVVHGPGWASSLFPGVPRLPPESRPDADVGVLLKPSFGAAFRWRFLPRRVGVAHARRGWLLTTPLPVVPAEHRREEYQRVGRALGLDVAGAPRYEGGGAAPAGLEAGFVVLNPWSPSPTVRWPYFRELALALRAARVPAVFVCGPGEAASIAAITRDFPLLPALPFPALGALLRAARVVVSNDSGIAHFAAANGVEPLVLHGSTDPARTGVGQPLVGPPVWCGPCYRKWCPFGLRCLRQLPVERVLDEVLARLRVLPLAR